MTHVSYTLCVTSYSAIISYSGTKPVKWTLSYGLYMKGVVISSFIGRISNLITSRVVKKNKWQ
ncbi:hypothetical protein K449DRAFT_441190 [Hypoxylon sp. EC38]|nr:hypothetical protein K449DRAFT_441190 [Hypoxylon sp. EC38]